MPSEIITYSAPASLSAFADKAAMVWNEVMAGLVVFKRASKPHIIIVFGSVDRSSDPTRVAQCIDYPGKRWSITLAHDTKWRLTWWDRLLGRGEDAFTALVHELGHVFDLPHSNDPDYVMFSQIGGNGKLSKAETVAYREHFIKHTAAA